VCFIASQWALPGFVVKRDKRLMANERSGHIATCNHISKPSASWYSTPFISSFPFSVFGLSFNEREIPTRSHTGKRGKRDVYCNKQVEEVVTVLNYMVKSLWGEGGSGGIRKKLKCKVQLICNIKINEMIIGSI